MVSLSVFHSGSGFLTWPSSFNCCRVLSNSSFIFENFDSNSWNRDEKPTCFSGDAASEGKKSEIL